MIDKLKDLNKIVSENSKIYLYGTEKICEAVIGYLEENDDCWKVSAVITPKGEKKSEEIRGIKVLDIAEQKWDKENLVVVLIKEKELEKTKIILEKYGLHNAVIMRDNLSMLLMKRERNKNLSYDTEFLVNKMRDQLLRLVPRPCMEYMVLNILDHCNLRCKGCDHFACIAEPYFVSFETLQKDLKRMAEILQGDNLMQIGVMGGEPLLHPDLLKILKMVRECFPYTIIRLSTNGLLLMQQKEEFWETCRKYDVTIVNTKYPIQLDFEKMKEKAKKENVRFEFFRGSGDDNVKTSFKKVITLEGTNNPVKSFAKCHISNFGNFLMEGKLYGCPFSCQSYRIFNKKFGTNLRMSEKDYLDIYKVQDMKEIFDFAAKPRPYCRYCSNLERGFEWERSKQDISEWV